MDQHSNGSNQNDQQANFYDDQTNQTRNDQPYQAYNQQHPSGFSNVPPIDPNSMPHSKLGIASFILSMIAIVGIVFTFILGASVITGIATDESFLTEIQNYANNPSSYTDAELMDSRIAEAALSFVGVFVLVIGAVVLSFVGIILGIIALSAKEKKRTFGLLGVIFNGLVLLGTIGLFLLGLVMGAAGV